MLNVCPTQPSTTLIVGGPCGDIGNKNWRPEEVTAGEELLLICSLYTGLRWIDLDRHMAEAAIGRCCTWLVLQVGTGQAANPGKVATSVQRVLNKVRQGRTQCHGLNTGFP